ncbi:MAG: CsbD family protein [Pseudomonadota bacterium]
MPNEDIVQGKWKQLKGKVQAQWGKLTNDDVDQIQGTQKELVGLLQERYGYEREYAEKELKSWLDKY